MATAADTDELVNGVLAHYGVPGMKWGFRKQGDGSVKKEGRTAKSEDAERATELRKKHVTEMSNAELRTLNERLQLEQSYASLAFKQDTKEIRQGQEIVKTILATGQMARDVTGLIDGAVQSPSVSIIRGLMGR